MRTLPVTPFGVAACVGLGFALAVTTGALLTGHPWTPGAVLFAGTTAIAAVGDLALAGRRAADARQREWEPLVPGPSPERIAREAPGWTP